jgi:hypothetical protein
LEKRLKIIPMPEIIYHLAAISVMLNLWLLAYSIPKLRREKEYWKRRSVWYERYVDDYYEEWENRPVKPLGTDPGHIEKPSE